MDEMLKAMYEKVEERRSLLAELEEKRKKVLGIFGKGKINVLRQNIGLELDLKRDDEERVRYFLEEVGDKRYAHTNHEYEIFEDLKLKIDVGEWVFLSLRWPFEYPVDDFSVYRNLGEGNSSIFSANLYRAQEDLKCEKRSKLFSEIREVYEEIRQGLEQ